MHNRLDFARTVYPHCLQGIVLAIGLLSLPASDPACAGIEYSAQATIQTPGGQVTYRASIEAISVRDADDRPSAEMVSFTYMSEVSSTADRPVIFLFNGGPIVPSPYLHLGLFGPDRLAMDDPRSSVAGNWRIVENRATLLDVADLVYVDPPGTGFSRLTSEREPETYYGIESDAHFVADFIYRWLSEHDRSDSPVYLFGESYGTIRAPVVASLLAKREEAIEISGLMLFGQAVNIIEYVQRPNNIISYVVSLPSLSVIAKYHDKSAYADLSVSELYDRAARFAREQYLPALFQGNQAASAELGRVADELERLTGISAQYYIDNRLRLSKQAFRRQLLAESDLLLGRYDARYTAEQEGDTQPDPAAQVSEAYLAAFDSYLTDHFGVDSDREYVPRADISSLADWEWSGSSPFSHFHYAEYIDKLFEAVDGFQLYIGSGHYDLTTTTGAADHLVRQSSWPLDRVMVRRYEAGHMAYSDAETAMRISEDIRAFLKDEDL